MNRRSYLDIMIKSCAALSLGTVTGTIGCTGASQDNKATKPIGIQLYTLRELTSKDFSGTLKTVAEIGYKAVEFAGFGGYSATDLKQLISDLGLVCAGSHTGYEALSEKPDELISYNATLGNPNIVIPSMPQAWREKGADGFKRFGYLLNTLGEKTRSAGIQLAYHNHNFEFEKENGTYLLEYLLSEADPELVKAEVDVYWVKKGGLDPADFLSKHAGRCTMIHMKDMTDDADEFFAPVGTGTLDMPSIIKAARLTPDPWFIVEQDRTKRPVLEAVTISYNSMRGLLGKA